MVTVEEATRSVFGAFRLALGDRRGMAFFERTPDGALRSFFAAVIVLPVHAVFSALRLESIAAEVPTLRLLMVEALFYVIAWTLFPVVMISICRVLQRSACYVDFLVAYNWAGVIAIVLHLPLLTFSLTGSVPTPAVAWIGLATFAIALTYEWYILRTALMINGFTATALVCVDLILDQLMLDISNAALQIG